MHPLIGKEEQQLVEILDALDLCISKGDSVNRAYEYLSDFVSLAKVHFRKEEKIMQDYKFPEMDIHKKEHAYLLEQLSILQSKLGYGHTPFGKEYMQSLRNWLEVHLFDTDDRLEKFLYQVDPDNHRVNAQN